ncbi:PREDICTED: peptidyl-prolyl cis-trans isomerase D-like [Fragaria vesca subsp. vesca]|uniref:peptidyl-prolyl cis-trans isomerase D-like n=1 Tax=Fragaria vesca subsp. vesca TaxID=101020 RepID=UPI0002C32AAC|nr:PREDICTED: peptidyl-prolyl cis-trans isomerase D-like [Fragaria vesca subsp. vesca]
MAKKKNKGTNEEKPLVYLEIEIDSVKKGQIEIKLFDDQVPSTAKNFRNLCKGTGGQFAVKSSDNKCFPVTDPVENIGKHDEPYLLSMANHEGILTIGSQFFITFSCLPQLDGKHVVFGKVVNGMDILHEMESVPTYLGRPMVPVVIVGCGEIDKELIKDKNLPAVTDAGK